MQKRRLIISKPYGEFTATEIAEYEGGLFVVNIEGRDGPRNPAFYDDEHDMKNLGCIAEQVLADTLEEIGYMIHANPV